MTDTTNAIADLSATELANRIAGKTLSPVEAVAAMLDRIAAREPKLQAFTEVFADDARLAAEGADRAIRSGHAVGPLHGVPIALKDLIDLEGRITMGGSAAHRARRAARTATIARRLIAQGMIVLGKTHTVEFAYGGWGTNPHLGTPWNPWDLAVARTPGGSSSGTGVAVAARMAPWGIGTDTGGSVRLPAAFCGLTGLKVTVGRVSTHGIVPLSATLDTPGPLARSVADAALLYAAISGPDPLDPATRGILPVDPFPTLNRGVRGLRLARMPEAERDGCSAEMLTAYDASLDVLSGLGAEIVDVALPFRFADLVAMSGITNAEAYFVNGALAERRRGRGRAARRRGARAHPRRPHPVGAGVPRDARAPRRAQARPRARLGRDRRDPDADHRDRGRAPGGGRRAAPALPLHALRQPARPVRPQPAERRLARRPAALAADRRPRLRRGAGPAHRAGVPGRDRLAPAGAVRVLRGRLFPPPSSGRGKR
jgi:aspartyl-tRNA(Asn)/glutamyl-tRNA(Gln) amidotransferase subunit A